MKIIHNFGKINSVVKDGGDEEATLMLSDGGSYAWIGQEHGSRYQGWFFESAAGLIKVIDTIRICNPGRFLAMENDFWRVKRIWQNNAEKLSLFGNDCLAYETDHRAEIEFFLDVKKSYQNPEFGRHYSVWQQGGLLMISYRQEKGLCLSEIFIAVAGDFGDISIKKEWICQKYALDEKRQSSPFERWIFLPARLCASCLVFAVGVDSEKTMVRAKNIWRDYESTKHAKRKSVSAPSRIFAPVFVGRKEREYLMAQNCAKKALKSLLFEREDAPALRAGLPWFFQVWQRDEAISLPALADFDWNVAREIFWRQVGELKNGNYHFGTADGASWLFFAAGDFLKRGKFNQKEKDEVCDCLQRSIDYLLQNNTKNDLAANCDREKTWMDSLDRSGAAIEIHALRANMYLLAANLANNEKEKKYYANLAENLKSAVCQKFFDKFQLADKFDIDNNLADFTCRPNIFLAAYVCPNLFSKNEWTKIFEWALARLWADWGGLATIDKGDPRFCASDTGEDPKAYHNGDSWFWINNIAALVMAQTDYEVFKNYIEKIFEASKNDIIWNGAIGYASEISSAEIYGSCGCPNQAWSAATFLQLCAQFKK